MKIKANKLERQKNESVDRPIIKFIPSGRTEIWSLHILT